MVDEKGLRIKIGELRSDLGLFKDLEVSIGRVISEEWLEEAGPTQFPSITDLRDWDLKLLQRYKPFYMPFCDLCCLCTFGKCDLTGDKRGACGLNMAGQQSRIVLLACCIGAATHISHARHLVDYLIEKFGRDHPIDVGGLNVEVEAPITRLVCGIKPKTLGDLEDVLGYLERELTRLL
ncbi:MAG: acetyl-CoA decarbonylase/synthase complex subunit alpha, partial [Candidatus Bathyarchaeia archaeon]|nr:acetyl-CoA decarbonylase/synthase complex subunit alpha [Candidatus Bathyarchaeota archaeon]